ncbi:unnamed protein product [Vitrella brassicaformis CCMP3155]|uniref:Uncharacterized protein n=1 Tax=Vitrella brassicaformis (strain CCMP3155) TaxID=1169540 RepID=A0A0G4G3D1_VITBC|nr:unnamed protein product [Vitrella brassicaformis CCMP3155]|eukprot:CEM22777.1 unnamed protein product [Vitrella brassicaformis CCMP3155]
MLLTILLAVRRCPSTSSSSSTRATASHHVHALDTYSGLSGHAQTSRAALRKLVDLCSEWTDVSSAPADPKAASVAAECVKFTKRAVDSVFLACPYGGVNAPMQGKRLVSCVLDHAPSIDCGSKCAEWTAGTSFSAARCEGRCNSVRRCLSREDNPCLRQAVDGRTLFRCFDFYLWSCRENDSTAAEAKEAQSYETASPTAAQVIWKMFNAAANLEPVGLWQ